MAEGRVTGCSVAAQGHMLGWGGGAQKVPVLAILPEGHIHIYISPSTYICESIIYEKEREAMGRAEGKPWEGEKAAVRV